MSAPPRSSDALQGTETQYSSSVETPRRGGCWKEGVLRPVRGKRIVAILAAGGLALAAAACGEKPERQAPVRPAAPLQGLHGDGHRRHRRPVVQRVGVGRPAGGQDRQSNVEPKYVASTAEADYEPNLRGFVDQKCNFILAVGGLMGDATKKVAAESTRPAVRHRGRAASRARRTSTRCSSPPTQAAFLAGYLAAGYSKTGKVATYGGLKIPPVTVFMDGFADGVAYYNKQKSKNVDGARLGQGQAERHLRRDASPTRTRARRSPTRSSPRAPTSIMPVAGGTGLGTADVGQGVRRQDLGDLGRPGRLQERRSSTARSS